MSLDILKKRIKENNLNGVFLFCGPEEYTKDHYVSQIRKKVDSSPLPEFNHLYFNASEDRIGDLEDAINSVPYMWDTKLVEIIELEGAKLTEADIEDYARIFSDLPDYVTVLAVLRADEKTEENRKAKTQKNSGIGAFQKVVSDFGLVVEFDNEKADKLITWIIRHFNAKGVKFDPNVPREIINICGNDMYILQGEILKLSEVFNENPLTVSDVKKYCCANTSYKYFDISDALTRRDMARAMKVLESLDLARDELTMAVGGIVKTFSDMLIVKTALDSGVGFDTIEKNTKMKSWNIQRIARTVSQTDIRFITFALSAFANADVKLKSFGVNPYRVLELTFYRICTYGKKA